MSITSFAIENLSNFYDFSNKENVKGLIKGNIGRFIKYETTENFLIAHPVKKIETFSKKEQNLLVENLKDNPFSTMIINHYNESIEGLEIKDKNDFIKKIKTLSEFLKSIPYNEPGFQFNAFERSPT